MKKNGFTLLELVVAMAVSALVITFALVSFHQLSSNTLINRSITVASSDLGFAAVQIKQDLRMAQRTDLDDGDPNPRSSINLIWVDYTLTTSETSTYHSCSYSLSGTNLLRDYDGTISIVGRNITGIGFTRNGKIITCVLTAADTSIRGRSITISFNVRKLPDVEWE